MSHSKRSNVCLNCSKTFEHIRGDARFCEPRCAAAWARNEGAFRDRFHAPKQEQNGADCEFCGTAFLYNDYAERGGQRRPKFCSNKCRQAAYRARKGVFAGKTSHWDDARNNKKQQTSNGVGGGKDTSQKTRAKDTSQEQTKDTSRNQTKKDTSQDKRWKSKDPYVVLGVTYQSTKNEIKQAWRALMRIWHPDVCTDEGATVVSQAINRAYDMLKSR
jgi:DnaJ domain